MLLELEEITRSPLHLLVGPDFGHVLSHTLNERGLVFPFLGSLLSLDSVDFLHLVVA